MDHDSPTIYLLQAALEAAVPMAIMEMQQLPLDQVMEIGRDCAQVIAEKGDIIQFKSKRRGETAKAFAALAHGIAAASFCPGGIRFAGMHFEAQHPEARHGPLGADPATRAGRG